MPNPIAPPRWRTAAAVLVPRAVGAAWAFSMVSLLVMAARDHHPEFASRLECGTDPRRILHAGETLDRFTLRFIVEAHCTNARYLSDERIALRYIGGEVDVEMRPLRIGGEPYYRIVSVGDEGLP